MYYLSIALPLSSQAEQSQLLGQHSSALMMGWQPFALGNHQEGGAALQKRLLKINYTELCCDMAKQELECC